jgi:hypothetical protein
VFVLLVGLEIGVKTLFYVMLCLLLAKMVVNATPLLMEFAATAQAATSEITVKILFLISLWTADFLEHVRMVVFVTTTKSKVFSAVSAPLVGLVTGVMSLLCAKTILARMAESALLPMDVLCAIAPVTSMV